jgi:hypothetical protein
MMLQLPCVVINESELPEYTKSKLTASSIPDKLYISYIPLGSSYDVVARTKFSSWGSALQESNEAALRKSKKASAESLIATAAAEFLKPLHQEVDTASLVNCFGNKRLRQPGSPHLAENETSTAKRARTEPQMSKPVVEAVSRSADEDDATKSGGLEMKAAQSYGDSESDSGSREGSSKTTGSESPSRAKRSRPEMSTNARAGTKRDARIADQSKRRARSSVDDDDGELSDTPILVGKRRSALREPGVDFAKLAAELDATGSISRTSIVSKPSHRETASISERAPAPVALPKTAQKPPLETANALYASLHAAIDGLNRQHIYDSLESLHSVRAALNFPNLHVAVFMTDVCS